MERIGLLALDEGPWLPLAGVRDALHAANALLGVPHYCVEVLASTAGDADRHDAPVQAWSALFVAACRPPENEDTALALQRALANLDPVHGVLAGIDAGSAWLAPGGWLDGHRCTIQAAFADAMGIRHPECLVSRNVFELDRMRLSCAGGTASLDMTITWLGRTHGHQLLGQLTQWFGLDRLRNPEDRQPVSHPGHGRMSPKLANALALMQANIGEPLSTNDIAELVGLSRRQLERLFRQHMDTLPSRWYLEQRLARAQMLLRQSSQSILQIGLSCGFNSGAHFSNAYRGYFGRTPRDERTDRSAAWCAQSDPPPAPSSNHGTPDE
ncbi:MAG: helix-turn-helix domain-containing protein [Pseudomonadota bacterium]|nr:helix-turn-helix domain-containing protein [Pseudomonadota bacterium]